MSERLEAVLVDLSIRRRPVGGGLSSGRAEWEDVRRTVGGARPDPWRGEGVVIDAGFDVSGESTVGSLGARSLATSTAVSTIATYPLIRACLISLASLHHLLT
jgi:hypothetical protein